MLRSAQLVPTLMATPPRPLSWYAQAKRCIERVRKLYATLPEDLRFFGDLGRAALCGMAVLWPLGELLAAATGHFPPLFLYGASGLKLVAALIFWVDHPVKAFVEHGRLDPWVATATKRIVGWAVVGCVALFAVVALDNAADAAKSQMKVLPAILSELCDLLTSGGG